MKNVIQSQKDWKDFKTEKRVGVIATLFTEQYLKESFELFYLTPDNYEEEIELNGITTVFIDNDLYESDHIWYRKNRGHIINYLKNKEKNICVIKNTTLDIAQTFKRAYVLDIDSKNELYGFSGLSLHSPLQINTDLINPINATQDKDIVFFHIGLSRPVINKKNYNMKREVVTELIHAKKVNRKVLTTLIEFVKNAKILYIYKTDQLDQITLEFIEKIAYLNATFVIYDYKFDQDIDENDGNAFRANNNKISILLKNPNYTLKLSLAKQRYVLKNDTFLLKQSLADFIFNRSNNGVLLPQVSIITSTNRKSSLDSYFLQMNTQKDVELELNIVTHGFRLSDEEQSYYQKKSDFPIRFMFAEATETLGACLNKCIEVSSFPVIAKIDDDDYYLDNYIIDQWLALKYSDAEVVGKSESYYYFESEDLIAVRKQGYHLKFDDFIMGATIMIKADLLKHLKFADIPKAVDTNLLRRIAAENYKIYVGHPFEMCVFRSKNNSQHTWQVNDLAMLKSAKIVGYGDPLPYVKIN